MHLLEIPREVIDAGLLPFLKWNDLLRLRRVCNWTKGITDAYLQVNPQLAPEIQINEGPEKTLEAFMAMDIPTTKLFLNNQSGYSFYEQIEEETEHQFLEDYGPHVKHLRVAQLTICPFGREMDFINGLKNLRSFEAGFFSNGRKNKEDELSSSAALLAHYEFAHPEHCHPRRCKEDRMLPPVFRNLESIKIGQDDEFVKTVDIVGRSMHTFLACPQLKYACHPFDSTFKEPVLEEVELPLVQELILREAFPKAIFNLMMYIIERPNLMHPSDVQGHLEFYDFQNFHNENVPWTLETYVESHDNLEVWWAGSGMFLDLCSRACETGLKLLNVNPSWFCARFSDLSHIRNPTELGWPVVSWVGLDPCALQLDMPNLKKITIPSTSGCVPGDYSRPEWPALECFDVTVDGKEGYVWDVEGKTRLRDIDRVVGKHTAVLFRFLFGNGVVSGNLSELSIRFMEGKEKKEVAVPKVEEIVESCPNLKRIKLGNWMGTNKQLVELWEGLWGLEEISLENCKELGNVAFVGEDVEFPVFFGLENLKKLSLKGLDKMPKITDTLFTLVLSKMKLRELVLTSDKPVEKVTQKGINALLAGPFAESIDRFPFRGWSLADMTAEEFQEMAKKFRSSDMI